MSTIPLLFEIAWKSLLVAGATLAVLRLAKDRTAAERSWIAHAGLVVLLALPAAALILPAWSPRPATIDATGSLAAPVAIPDRLSALAAANRSDEMVASPQTVPAAALTLPSPETMVLWLYGVPLALLALTMLVAVIRLAAMRGRAQVMEDAPWLTALARAQRRMGFKHGTALLVSDELRSPISWGVVSPIILLDRKALVAGAEAEAIIAHELAHVARLDWAKLLVSRAACALLWFNPLVWMLAREAHQLREEAADDAVLMSEVDGADYAALLVNAARHDNQGLLIAAHGVAPGKDSLKRRVTRVLDASLPRRPTSAVWTGAGLLVLAGLAAPLAAFDPITICTDGKVDGVISEHVEMPAAATRAIELASAVLPAGVLPAVTPVSASADVAHAKRRLTPDELIQMKTMGVTRRDLDALAAAGVTEIDAGQATAAKAMGMTPEYIDAMRRAVPGADFESIMSAKAMGIDPDEARSMRRSFPGADLEDLAAARATGVTPAYAAEMTRLIPGVTVDDLAGMRAVGVDAAFVRSMQGRTRGPLDVDDVVEARVVGFSHAARTAAEVRRATAEVRAATAQVRASAASAARERMRVNPPVAPVAPVPAEPVPNVFDE